MPPDERPPQDRRRARAYALSLGVVLAASAIALVLIGRRQAIDYDSYWHVFIARQDRWPNFWREVRDNAHPPLFYFMLRAASALFGPHMLVYRLVSIASTVAATIGIAAIVRRTTVNRTLAVLAAAAFGLSSGAIATGLEVRAYSMCAALTMTAFVFYLDWFRSRPGRRSRRAAAGFAIAASAAVLTHYSTFFFLAAAVATPFALAIVSLRWRRRIGRHAYQQPVATALMFAAPLAVAVGAYAVHVVLWGGGRLGHVPAFMFNSTTETAWQFLRRNTANLAAILVPGGSEFVAGIHNTVHRGALAFLCALGAAALTQIGRRRAPRLAPIPVIVLIVMIALNAVGGLTYRYPYGGAARHEFFLVPFAVVVVFTFVETLRRSLPRAFANRRLTAALVAGAVAASIASWVSMFQLQEQAMYQTEMDHFRRAVSAPRAVLLDQFSFIIFFSHYHDWIWRAGDDTPGHGVRQVWSVSKGDARMAICRDGQQWSFDMADAYTFDTVLECGQRSGVGRVAIFRMHWWEAVAPTGFVNDALAAADGLSQTAIVSDGDSLSVEFEIDPARLHECSAPPPPPTVLRVVSNVDRTVSLAWDGVGGQRTRYIIEAGRRPGGSDVLDMALGRDTRYTATRVTPATYYARVRAKNLCGTSGPSNELRVVVP